MNKLEKVKQGLDACTELECPDACPYKRGGSNGYCVHNLHRDALDCIEETKVNRVFKRSAIGLAWLLYPLALYKIFQLIFGR